MTYLRGGTAGKLGGVWPSVSLLVCCTYSVVREFIRSGLVRGFRELCTDRSAPHFDSAPRSLSPDLSPLHPTPCLLGRQTEREGGFDSGGRGRKAVPPTLFLLPWHPMHTDSALAAPWSTPGALTSGGRGKVESLVGLFLLPPETNGDPLSFR